MDTKQTLEQYVAAGYRMFPCKPNSKVPAVAWTKFVETDKATDVEYLLEKLNQGHNIAVALKPSGYVALDVDSYRDGINTPELPQTGMVQVTPRGGTHYLYKPNGYASLIRDVQLGEYGIDVKYHGYILLAPSKVKYDTGHEGQYQWTSWESPADLPYDVVQWFDNGTKPTHSETTDFTLVVSEDDLNDPVDSFVKLITDGFTEGQHNKQLHEAARTLYRVMASDNPDLQANLTAKILLALDSKDDTPQGQYQAMETIKSGMAYEYKRLVEKGVVKSSKSPVAEASFSVSSYADVLTDYENFKIEYIIEDLLPRSAILMMTAPPETYKTWLLMDMAASIALNKPFAGRYNPLVSESQINGVSYGEPVLFIQQEDFVGLQVQRLQTILTAKWGADNIKVHYPTRGNMKEFVIETPEYAPIIMHTDRQLSLDRPESFEALEKVVKENGVSYVFIDPFYTLSGSTKDYFANAGQQFQLIRDVRDTTGAGFLIAHHSKKSASGDRGRDNAWGSQFLLGAVEGMFSLKPRAANKVDFEVSGKFFPTAISAGLTFDIDTEAQTYNLTLEEFDANLTGNMRTVYEILCDCGTEGATPTSIESDYGINRGTASKMLKALVGEDLAIKTGKVYIANVNVPNL